MLFALLTAVWLHAAPPGPLEVVRQGNGDVQKVSAARGARAEQIYRVLERFVDFGELTRRALGDTWTKLTPAQRREVVDNMEGLLRASYAQKALGQGHSQIEYGEERITGREARVATTLVLDGDKYPVVYKLYRAEERAGWRIYDVVTDNTSLLESYQGQFKKLLAERGLGGLLATLKARRAQVERALPR